jgi:hypothetical protein
MLAAHPVATICQKLPLLLLASFSKAFPCGRSFLYYIIIIQLLISAEPGFNFESLENQCYWEFEVQTTKKHNKSKSVYLYLRKMRLQLFLLRPRP